MLDTARTKVGHTVIGVKYSRDAVFSSELFPSFSISTGDTRDGDIRMVAGREDGLSIVVEVDVSKREGEYCSCTSRPGKSMSLARDLISPFPL